MNSNDVLTTGELEILLENWTPHELREREAARLDAEGTAFLARFEKELNEVKRGLLQSGETFREELPPMPRVQLPVEFSSFAATMPQAKLADDFSTYHHMAWWRRPQRISNGMLALVATLFLILGGAALHQVLILREEIDQFRHPDEKPVFHHDRSAVRDKARTQGHYDDLFEASMDGGNALFEVGRISSRREVYEDALHEFLKAHKLKPLDTRALRALARTYEKLGMHEKKQEYLDKLAALKS
ncbi:MAG: hypothetical protein QNK37_34310 [Acidobacteriota bacterium]|nr:hypothetical protein [Acidobacteriota bacterium]